jgi:hypothetical protein
VVWDDRQDSLAGWLDSLAGRDDYFTHLGLRNNIRNAADSNSTHNAYASK